MLKINIRSYPNWGEPERTPHRSVVDACVVHTTHAQNFMLRIRKPTLVGSQCVHCTYVACTKIQDRKTESPTGQTVRVSHVRKNTLTHGAAW